MKCFDSSHKVKIRTGLILSGRQIPAVAYLALLLVAADAHSQAIVDEVELPKAVILQSGVPIPNLKDAARQAITSDSARQSEQQTDAQLREYRLGANTIREYRVGRHLQHIEVISDSGLTYIVENDRPHRVEERRPSSGIKISGW